MRKKKNLLPRLSACSDYFVSEKPSGWRTKEGQPLYLEIGCGKGRFCVQSALEAPDCMFVACEREPNVIVLAAEKAKAAALSNIKFISADAVRLREFFDDSDVDRIYLNFSDPWPPKGQWKRRLTHRRVLKEYDPVLKSGGELFFKTDNSDFFDFTLSELPECGYEIRWYTRDLHSENVHNVLTEYEENFSSKGMKINYLEAVKK
ncbi:MAG: tRNA (guanosine(46)-N7)-methyltransferase TrmB [Clostridia bacterium]|nr:tRNA (guanosine(46)-N7)-methyltransferase TrmB [Clostridia bacterium]